MVFNPEETADQLKKQGGFIPGVRPGTATSTYIKTVIDRVTLPGAIFMAVLAIRPNHYFLVHRRFVDTGVWWNFRPDYGRCCNGYTLFH